MSDQFSHKLKLDWASHHLNSLDAKVRDWRDGETHDYAVEFDRESGKQRVKVKLSEPPPDEFRLIIGDCLHNLRSALDNLIYELAVAYTGFKPLPEDRAKRLEFPIFGPKAMSADACRKRIGCIHPDAQTIIKGLQPHNRGDKFASHPFWKLYQLSNMDKHRVPHITLLAVSTYADFPEVPGLPGTLTINFGPFEDGAEIATYTPLTGDFDPEVHMDPLLTFGIAFGQGSATPGWNCSLALRWLHSHIVRDAVEPLAPYLT